MRYLVRFVIDLKTRRVDIAAAGGAPGVGGGLGLALELRMPDTIDILIVDDEQRNLDTLQAILDDPTYRLLRAVDADTALRLLMENDVAAIVLDIKMPGVSSFELAQLIKGTKKFRQIPIVVLAAYLVDDQDVLASYRAGAVDYLTKPVNPQILRHKVAVFADLFRKTRALAELNEHLETRVQERTAELEQSEKIALREANRQRDRFLATLAELRNPLAPLRTGLDLLLHQPEQPAIMARTLAAMNRHLAHMVRVIDDLLDVSRISAGRLELGREHIDLSSVIERAIETARPSLLRRNQAVTVDAAAPVFAFVDATRISQIIGNLLNNASEASPAGASVRIELAREGDNALIRVVDEGTGIPFDQLPRVFDMFTKVERAGTGTSEGLGVGLALSRQMAELHGGQLTAASAGERKGATFTLSIPTGKQENVADAVAPDSATHTRPPTALNVVVVEDNEDSADMLSTWLETLGHAVRVAHSGPDGVALVLETRPDVVLCDIGLPGMEGVEVCRHVVSGMSPPPVMVALTGWGMEADRKQTGEAGFKYHLVKPVELDQLRTVLQSIGPSGQNGAGTPSRSSQM